MSVYVVVCAILVVIALFGGIYLLSNLKVIEGWLCIATAIVLFIAGYSMVSTKVNSDKFPTEQTCCSCTECKCNYTESLEE